MSTGVDRIGLGESLSSGNHSFRPLAADRHPNDFILMVMDSTGGHKAKAFAIPDTRLPTSTLLDMNIIPLPDKGIMGGRQGGNNYTANNGTEKPVIGP
jgi:hypothetical protein